MILDLSGLVISINVDSKLFFLNKFKWFQFWAKWPAKYEVPPAINSLGVN